MTRAGRNSLIAAAALVVAGLAGELLDRRRPRRRNPRRNPWVTLRNRHRVLIDDEGRIEGGALPSAWHGAHVGDVPELGRQWREIDDAEEECAEETGRRARATFRGQREALAALYDANPHLVEFMETEARGSGERAYKEWIAGGRRGPKPTRARGDGRFDALNEGLERRGRRAVASWSEAVRAVVPPSKRWADFGARLELLEDATGLRLALPGPAEAIELGDRGAECEQLGEGARERLIERARTGRLSAVEPADVPF